MYTCVFRLCFLGENLVTKLSEVPGKVEQYFNKKVLMKIGDCAQISFCRTFF